MPFTITHVVAVAPLRRRLPFSALAIGAMAPDFWFFARLRVSWWGHEGVGLLAFTVPVALVVTWLWHAHARHGLYAILPEGGRVRLACLMGPTTRHGGLWILAVLLGVATHIGWDQFTHMGTWVTDHWAALREPLFETERGVYRVCHLVQRLSDVLFFVLVFYVWWWMRRPPAPHEHAAVRGVRAPRGSGWAWIGVSLLAGFVHAVLRGPAPFDPVGFVGFGLNGYLATVPVAFLGLLWLGRRGGAQIPPDSESVPGT